MSTSDELGGRMPEPGEYEAACEFRRAFIARDEIGTRDEQRSAFIRAAARTQSAQRATTKVDGPSISDVAVSPWYAGERYFANASDAAFWRRIDSERANRLAARTRSHLGMGRVA